ncbi:MAG: hypothetical protein ACTSUK_00990 [Promethearchaeota archaeon]
MGDTQQQPKELTPAEKRFHEIMQEIKEDLDETHGVGAALTPEYEQDFQLQICEKLTILLKENEGLKTDVENLKRQLINRS